MFDFYALAKKEIDKEEIIHKSSGQIGRFLCKYSLHKSLNKMKSMETTNGIETVNSIISNNIIKKLTGWKQDHTNQIYAILTQNQTPSKEAFFQNCEIIWNQISKKTSPKIFIYKIKETIIKL